MRAHGLAEEALDQLHTAPLSKNSPPYPTSTDTSVGPEQTAGWLQIPSWEVDLKGCASGSHCSPKLRRCKPRGRDAVLLCQVHLSADGQACRETHKGAGQGTLRPREPSLAGELLWSLPSFWFLVPAPRPVCISCPLAP